MHQISSKIPLDSERNEPKTQVNMIPRHLSTRILKYSKQYPIIALVGPRQSGKTTLSKALFSKYKYVSLENLSLRKNASDDPDGFLDTYGKFLILDEVQHVPELFSSLQERVDTDQEPGQYVLTGSSQFLLVEKIAQSLAGRIITFKLFPLSYTELYRYKADSDFSSIFKVNHKNRGALHNPLEKAS